jgi:hypothetical protein
MNSSLKEVSFKGKNHLLKNMPIYIKNNDINHDIFLFLIIIFFVVIVLCFVDLKASRNVSFIIYMVVFFVIYTSVSLFSLWHTLKSGSFVMAADQKGIYYRIFKERDVYILIEWRYVVELVDHYSTHYRSSIIVKTMLENYEIPSPSNAVFCEWPNNKNVNISFTIPRSIDKYEIIRRLDELKVKSQNAMLT